MLVKIGTGRTGRAFGESVGGTGDVETGKLCLEGRKEPGGGRRLEGQDEPGDEGVGNRGEEPSECGESSRGAPRDGSVWNQRVFVELGCRNLADGPDAV